MPSLSAQYPAPSLGLNDRDPLATMPPGYLVQSSNFFPLTLSLKTRGGSVEKVSGLPVPANTLLVYRGASISRLFAAAGTAIYDCSGQGPVGAPVVTGKTTDKYDQVLFGGAAGNHLIVCNGFDLPMAYNGATWANLIITGVDAKLFSAVTSWKSRLFFTEKNSLRAWYLDTNAIQGAASVIDFSSLARRGGKIVSLFSLPSSAAVNISDYLVAVTDQGEMIVYGGSDPSQASSFPLIGTYRIGIPLAGSEHEGSRWVTGYGAQTLAITSNGITSLTDILNESGAGPSKQITDTITRAINTYINLSKNDFGWQLAINPTENIMYLNIPAPGGAVQYVLNTVTFAWGRYDGMPMTCMGIYDDKLVGAMGTSVYFCDIPGVNDFTTNTSTGVPIFCKATTSFITQPEPGRLKSYKMVRPFFRIQKPLNPVVNINVDYALEPISGQPDAILITPSEWGPSPIVGKWGPTASPGKWQGAAVNYRRWTNVTGRGYQCALVVEVEVDKNALQWIGWDLVFESGGIL